jgi:hypothetical protein
MWAGSDYRSLKKILPEILKGEVVLVLNQVPYHKYAFIA